MSFGDNIGFASEHGRSNNGSRANSRRIKLRAIDVKSIKDFTTKQNFEPSEKITMHKYLHSGNKDRLTPLEHMINPNPAHPFSSSRNGEASVFLKETHSSNLFASVSLSEAPFPLDGDRVSSVKQLQSQPRQEMSRTMYGTTKKPHSISNTPSEFVANNTNSDYLDHSNSHRAGLRQNISPARLKFRTLSQMKVSNLDQKAEH